jgi:hypothetical protein
VRTFRSLESLARRLGLTFNNGGQVTNLPVVEAVLPVAVIDDWRPTRIPLQRLRWGCRVSVSAVVATFSAIRIRAQQRALLIEYVDLTDNPAVGLVLMGRVAQQSPAGLDIAQAVRLIEGPNAFLPSLGTELADATVVSGNIAAIPDDLTGGGAFAVEPVSTTIKDTRPDQGALPILLLPGEDFWIMSNVLNTVVRAAFTWTEFPSISDLRTTVASRDPRS